MTDSDLVSKKLTQIETRVQELQTLARPEEIENDVREERFVEHTLQIAVQSVIDVATHIVSDERLGTTAAGKVSNPWRWPYGAGGSIWALQSANCFRSRATIAG